MPRVIIRRDKTLISIMRDVTIVIDGERKATVSHGGTVDVTILPGAHAIEARSGSTASEVTEFTIAEKGEVRFLCYFTGLFGTGVCLTKISEVSFSDRFGGARAQASAGRIDYHAEALPEWCQVLGVSPQASEHEIRTAYLKLIKRYHPDTIFAFHREPKEIADQKAREINAAYSAATRRLRK